MREGGAFGTFRRARANTRFPLSGSRGRSIDALRLDGRAFANVARGTVRRRSIEFGRSRRSHPIVRSRSIVRSHRSRRSTSIPSKHSIDRSRRSTSIVSDRSIASIDVDRVKHSIDRIRSIDVDRIRSIGRVDRVEAFGRSYRSSASIDPVEGVEGLEGDRGTWRRVGRGITRQCARRPSTVHPPRGGKRRVGSVIADRACVRRLTTPS